MCECSGNHSESNPRASASRASSTGWIPRSVGNIITPRRIEPGYAPPTAAIHPWRSTKSNSHSRERRVGRRMALEDQRIVTGNDDAARAGERTQQVIAGDHRGYVE